MVGRYPLEPPSGDPVSAGVADVDDVAETRVEGGRHQRRRHSLGRGMLPRVLEDHGTRLFGRLDQALRQVRGRPLVKTLPDPVDGEGTGDLPRDRATHAVAN